MSTPAEKVKYLNKNDLPKQFRQVVSFVTNIRIKEKNICVFAEYISAVKDNTTPLPHLRRKLKRNPNPSKHSAVITHLVHLNRKLNVKQNILIIDGTVFWKTVTQTKFGFEQSLCKGFLPLQYQVCSFTIELFVF